MSQIVATNYIAWAVIWLLKLCVPLTTTFLAHLMVQSGSFGCEQEELHSTFNVLVPVCLIALVFSFTFMGILDTSIEVILVTFCKLKDVQEEIAEEHPGVDVMSYVPKNIAQHFSALKKSDAEEKADGEEDDGPRDEDPGNSVEMEKA